MESVWVIKNNGHQVQEQFINRKEAIDYAKRSSVNAMCSIRSQGSVPIFYEFGEPANIVRSVELQKAVVEILEYQNERFALEYRGKAVRKKV
jgi:hypothetical protein